MKEENDRSLEGQYSIDGNIWRCSGKENSTEQHADETSTGQTIQYANEVVNEV